MKSMHNSWIFGNGVGPVFSFLNAFASESISADPGFESKGVVSNSLGRGIVSSKFDRCAMHRRYQ